MDMEYTMIPKKCGFCGKPIPKLKTEYYVIEGNERKQLCVFCYARVMLQLQGRGERA